MKFIKTLTLLFFVFHFTSCKKDPITVLPINSPPIAHAGKDISITLPKNSIVLDGSASRDPDNNIIGYLWSKIQGPSILPIEKAKNPRIEVIFMSEGIYQFQLNVMDAGNLFTTDTVRITVNPDTTPNSELIFDNLEWIYYHGQYDYNSLSDALYLSVSDINNLLPDASNAKLHIYVKRDPTMDWEQANLMKNGNCISPYSFGIGPESLIIFDCDIDLSLIGKKGAIKVNF